MTRRSASPTCDVLSSAGRHACELPAHHNGAEHRSGAGDRGTATWTTEDRRVLYVDVPAPAPPLSLDEMLGLIGMKVPGQ